MVRSIALLALMEAQRHGRWGSPFFCKGEHRESND
jgi:hypothetical protein